MRIIAILCIAACAVLSVGGQPLSEDQLFKSFEEVLEKVIELRQLSLKKPIERGIKSKDEIRGYLIERLQDTYPAAEIEREARVLKRLGLIPVDMDFDRFIVDLMTEQVAGYYDPYAGTFYIADWLDPQIQKPVMAHELVHALQDQHYDLKPFLERIEGNDDRTLARSAVVEGDGLAVMLHYMLSPMGLDFRTMPNLSQMGDQQAMLMASQFPIFAGAPPYLRESLLFPYTSGAAFLQTYLKTHDWAELGAIYADMPVSTEQILHPEKYFGVRDEPTDVASREDSSGEVVYSNTVGEFTLRMVLQSFLDKPTAQDAAAGWDGDRLELIEEGDTEILRLTTVWDSAADATEFCRAYETVLNQKLPGVAGAVEEFAPGSGLRYSWLDEARPARMICREESVEVTERAPLAAAGDR